MIWVSSNVHGDIHKIEHRNVTRLKSIHSSEPIQNKHHEIERLTPTMKKSITFSDAVPVGNPLGTVTV